MPPARSALPAAASAVAHLRPMAESTAPPVLPPDAGARLAEFARACKAAARAVSLYPAAHPAIGTTLGRLVAGRRAMLTANGPYRLQVLADALLIGGAAPAQPGSGDRRARRAPAPALDRRADAERRRRRRVVAHAPAAARARARGSARRRRHRHLWATAGGPSIEIEEIDYAEVLREKQGVAATIEQIIAAALAGPAARARRSGMRAAARYRAGPRPARRS